MNIYMGIIIVMNLMITFYSMLEYLYIRNKDNKKYKSINKYIFTNMKNSNIKIENKCKKILKNKNNIGLNEITKYKNKEMLNQCVEIIHNLFSVICKDKYIYSSIRICNYRYTFSTIADSKNDINYSQKKEQYLIDDNTDLIYIFKKHYSIFVISNVSDFKKNNSFILKNKELERITKALISIPLNDNKKVIGCYTIYFSKPLDDKIEIEKINDIFNYIKTVLDDLVKNYIELNKNYYDDDNNDDDDKN